ncbi:MAG: aminomethyl-transferring glycine dehydrogenase subunit GcvPA [Ruminococcaceae bacterium]|jgi:glycine dehydrogenase subunit 1|nr:aminomethyl-transferring glycine dehydrogenase subunit GcvPA [Oscillospiraceae bacterium]
MGSYIPSTGDERLEMLKAIGLNTVEDLYAAVPESARLKSLNLPEGLSEMEVAACVSALAEKNKVFRSVFRGAGSYRHYIPSIVKTITSKEEFVTAYTPYQAEISQGVLQSIFEYQTEICELTGMDVSNASVYDGGTAAAEAVLMNVDNRRRKTVVISETVNPGVIEVVKTYCGSRNVPVTVVPAKDHVTDLEALKAALTNETASFYFQSPNYFGILEDAEALIAASHEVGAKVAMGVNPISMGLLKTPAEYGADIACGEGQPLGLSTAFGGPYLGFMACTKDMMRKLPGRIVGETTDAQGRRAYVLTLQAREQHIRREKASSNICSNEALCAMTAAVYLAAVGPEGLQKVAKNSAAHAHYLAQKLSEIEGFKLVEDKTFFHEFLMTCPICPYCLNERLAEHGILGGLPVDGGILWCATELNTRSEIDNLVALVAEIVKEEASK